jgi:type IV secretory pathway VirB2 component (pilin)
MRRAFTVSEKTAVAALGGSPIAALPALLISFRAFMIEAQVSGLLVDRIAVREETSFMTSKAAKSVRHRIGIRLQTIAAVSFVTVSLPLRAQAASPWENAVDVLQTAFTGPIARGLSLVAIVVGGLMFAFGEGESKRMLAGIVFGIGMAIGAVNFMAWLFP